MPHIRPVHCPHCGSIDYFETYKSDPIDKVTEDGEDGTGIKDILTARSKNNTICSTCENEFGIKFKHVHKDGEVETMFQVSPRLFDLPPEDFVSVRFGYPDNINVEYKVIVREGPHVNTTILPEDEYEPFKSGKRFFPLDEFTREEVIRTKIEGQVSPGDYRFIIHNTTDEVVQIECQLSGSIVFR